MPNLAIINELKGYNIYYFGSNGMEKEIIKKHPNIYFVEIEAVKLVRSLTPKNLLILSLDKLNKLLIIGLNYQQKKELQNVFLICLILISLNY